MMIFVFQMYYMNTNGLLSQLVISFLDADERQGFTAYADGIFNKVKYIHMLGLKMSYTGDGTIIDCVEVLTNELLM